MRTKKFIACIIVPSNKILASFIQEWEMEPNSQVDGC